MDRKGLKVGELRVETSARASLTSQLSWDVNDKESDL